MMIFLSLLLLGLCGVCSPVVVLSLSVRLSWYPILWCGCGCCGDCDACIVVFVACVYAARLYMGGTRGSGVLSGAGDVLERCRWSVRHVYVFGSGWGVRCWE